MPIKFVSKISNLAAIKEQQNANGECFICNLRLEIKSDTRFSIFLIFSVFSIIL